MYFQKPTYISWTELGFECRVLNAALGLKELHADWGTVITVVGLIFSGSLSSHTFACRHIFIRFSLCADILNFFFCGDHLLSSLWLITAECFFAVSPLAFQWQIFAQMRRKQKYGWNVKASLPDMKMRYSASVDEPVSDFLTCSSLDSLCNIISLLSAYSDINFPRQFISYHYSVHCVNNTRSTPASSIDIDIQAQLVRPGDLFVNFSC